MRHFFGRKNQNEYLMKFKITTKKIRKIHLVQTNMVVQQGFREVLSRSVDKYVCACVCDWKRLSLLSKILLQINL